jgi:8-oxo-dGTP diphosphatase
MPKRLHELGQLIVACETYIVHNDRVLMHKRADDKEKFPGFWLGPGGHVDAGEDVFSTSIREVQEETGVILQPKDVQLKVLAFHHHLDRGEVWMEYLFRATVPHDVKVKSTEEGKTEWIEIDTLTTMQKVFPPSKYYFDHILNNKPGILYNASEWKNSELVKVLSQRLDGDY